MCKIRSEPNIGALPGWVFIWSQQLTSIWISSEPLHLAAHCDNSCTSSVSKYYGWNLTSDARIFPRYDLYPIAHALEAAFGCSVVCLNTDLPEHTQRAYSHTERTKSRPGRAHKYIYTQLLTLCAQVYVCILFDEMERSSSHMSKRAADISQTHFYGIIGERYSSDEKQTWRQLIKRERISQCWGQ